MRQKTENLQQNNIDHETVSMTTISERRIDPNLRLIFSMLVTIIYVMIIQYIMIKINAL